MRVLEPRQFHHLKQRRSKRTIKILPVLAVLLLTPVAVYAWQHPPKLRRAKPVPAAQVNTAATYEPANDPKKPRTLKTFTGNDFKKLFQNLALPNTQAFSEPPAITGDAEADKRIRAIAEARGYRLSTIPVNAIVRTEEALGDADDLLQPLAYAGWQSLKAAAEKDKIPLVLYSAYRSPEFQRELFLGRLYARGITARQIVTGEVDAAVEATLLVTAVPGYSRHHNGYTVDFRCEDGSGNFGASSCFRWLNENNYKRAKEHGWIPSYPEEAEQQGPEPEPWEYVWVGLDAVSEQ